MLASIKSRGKSNIVHILTCMYISYCILWVEFISLGTNRHFVWVSHPHELSVSKSLCQNVCSMQ